MPPKRYNLLVFFLSLIVEIVFPIFQLFQVFECKCKRVSIDSMIYVQERFTQRDSSRDTVTLHYERTCRIRNTHLHTFLAGDGVTFMRHHTTQRVKRMKWIPCPSWDSSRQWNENVIYICVLKRKWWPSAVRDTCCRRLFHFFFFIRLAWTTTRLPNIRSNLFTFDCSRCTYDARHINRIETRMPPNTKLGVQCYSQCYDTNGWGTRYETEPAAGWVKLS